jgi:dipeptidase
VASNCFRIRDINPADPNILYSRNLFEVAQARGWWKPQNGTLDWLETVSTGEYSHPYYSLARIWSVYNRIAPSQNLSPYVNDTWSREYPFSIKPDKKLSTRDTLRIFRDHYEGTVFDLTRGMAAGPYGNPYRNDGPFDSHQAFEPGEIKPGAWPRPVSPIFCSYSYITQGRSWLPDPIGGLCWFGFAQPNETCYMPIYAGVKSVPEEFHYGSRSAFDRGCAWWAFNFVANWATLRYSDMVKDISSEQAYIEGRELSNQSAIDDQADRILKSRGAEDCGKFLTDYCTANALSVLDDWWSLADLLIVKYSNGMINDFQNNTSIRAGYPNWWLNETGYQYGPRIYQYAQLQNITGLIYVNETVYTEPGNEVNYLQENQKA